MVFSSVSFLFLFLPIICFICLALNYFKLTEVQNVVLLIFSLLFFSWTQPWYLWILLLSILLNYFGAICMERMNQRKQILILCVAANVILLGGYKYADFLREIYNVTFGRKIGEIGVALPIGISFFTFQGMSYLIDVYRKDVPAQRNPLKVALYVALFPQLVAGPIVRYGDVVRELDSRHAGVDDVYEGICRFITGLGKKVILADSMGAIIDGIWKQGSNNHVVWIAWIGSIAFTLQLYYDFSGYSDMAIGLGRVLGFHFPENFNLPYISQSVSEFWRRWHISLSGWFRDYVYIPLGGNRKHKIRNLSIVFVLTGLWHGAGWTFVFWGCFHGVLVVAERLLGIDRVQKWRLPAKVYTLFMINLGGILFRAPNLSAAFQYLGNMFGIKSAKLAFYEVDKWSALTMVLALFFATRIPTRVKEKLKGPVWGVAGYFALLFILVLSSVSIIAGSYHPFIYFQF